MKEIFFCNPVSYPIRSYLLIKKMKRDVQNYVFLARKEDEWQVDRLVETLQIDREPYFFKKIYIPKEGGGWLYERLQKEICPDTVYHVDLTGGSKIFSIALFRLMMQNHIKVRFYYVYENHLDIKVITKEKEYMEELRTKISLKDALNILNLKIFSETEIKKPEGFLSPGELMDTIRKVKKIANPQDYTPYGKLNEQENEYLSGRWFEWYLYDIIKNELGLHKKYIKTGVQLKIADKNGGNQNVDLETDVLFIYQNKLYNIECKVISNMDIKKVYKNFYKLAGVSQYFKNKINTYLFALAKYNNSQNMEAIKSRVKALGLRDLVGWNILKDEQKLKEYIKNKF
jgi:hypothetical protein